MQQGSHGSKRRRIQLVDHKWQLPLVLGIGCSAFAGGLLLLVANYLLSDPDTLDGLSGQQTAQLVLAVDVGFVVVVSVMLVLVTMRITNSVSGPAMMLERAVEALRAGQFDSRLKFRKGDYMQGLAGALESLTQELRGQRNDLSSTCAELQRALSAGDMRAASALALELQKAVEKPLANRAARNASVAGLSNPAPAAPLSTANDASSAKTLAGTTPTRGRQSGFTILETLIGLVLLTFGVGVAVVTGLRCAHLQRTTETLVQAHNAGRDVIEQCQTGGLLPKHQQYTAAPTHAAGDLQISVQFPADKLSEGLGGAIPPTSRFNDADADGQLEVNALATDPVGLLPVRVRAQRAGFSYSMDTLVIGP